MAKWKAYALGSAAAILVLRGMVRGGFGASAQSFFASIFINQTQSGGGDA